MNCLVTSVCVRMCVFEVFFPVKKCETASYVVYLLHYLLTQNYFMNGAKLLVYNLEASNGIVHIIDSLMYEGGQSINAYTYINRNDVQVTDASERTK